MNVMLRRCFNVSRTLTRTDAVHNTSRDPLVLVVRRRTIGVFSVMNLLAHPVGTQALGLPLFSYSQLTCPTRAAA